MNESLKIAIREFVYNDPSGILCPSINLTSSKIEDLVGFKVLEPFLDWLKFANGCYVGHGGIHGINTVKPVADLLADLNVYPQWRSRSWLPVGYDAFGNIFVLDCDVQSRTSGFVSFFDLASSEDEPEAIVARSFEKFLTYYLSKEAEAGDWPVT